MVVRKIKEEGIPDTLIIPLADSDKYEVELIKEGEVSNEKLSCLLTENLRGIEIFGSQVRDGDGKEVGLVLKLGKKPQKPKPDVVFVAETDDYVALLKMDCRISQMLVTSEIQAHRQECSKNAPSQNKNTP